MSAPDRLFFFRSNKFVRLYEMLKGNGVVLRLRDDKKFVAEYSIKSYSTEKYDFEKRF